MSKIKIDPYPSDEIRVLLRIRNMSQHDLAEKADIGYHTVNKVVSVPFYRTTAGTLRRRDAYDRHRVAIAKALGLPYESVWGSNARETLRDIIAKELRDSLFQEEHERMRRRLLPQKKTRSKNRIK